MVRGGMEFSEFKQLADRFHHILDNNVVDLFLKEILLDMAKKLVSKTKRKTPVNTGLLRESWQIGHIEQRGNNYMVEVYSEIEYASFVENGFRAHWVPGEWKANQFVYDPNAKTGMQVGKKGGWVQGKFMMTLSVKEIEREMPRFLERKQTEFLNRLLNGR
ncbi:HK97 gp10 family phage protein [Schinkia azotoformans]|uniref:HK97 gp10 family phage protein n=1 Tax=Schinkia azotoformans TaxID=1454 RepID=UPI002E24A0CC|nr:HK97 gp10 family phage protein [Schinkia azotoformans]